MRVQNDNELKAAIEKYEVLYLSAQDYSLRAQIWQTLVFLREKLKSKKTEKGFKKKIVW